MQEILPPYIRRILGIMAVVIPIAAFIFFRYKFLDLIRSRTLWALLTVGWCFWAISGGVWNWILGPKLFQKTKEGFRIIVLHEDYQTLSEMFCIAALNAGVTLGMIILIETAKARKNRTQKIPQSFFLRYVYCIFYGYVKPILGFALIYGCFITLNYCYLIKLVGQ